MAPNGPSSHLKDLEGGVCSALNLLLNSIYSIYILHIYIIVVSASVGVVARG